MVEEREEPQSHGNQHGSVRYSVLKLTGSDILQIIKRLFSFKMIHGINNDPKGQEVVWKSIRMKQSGLHLIIDCSYLNSLIFYLQKYPYPLLQRLSSMGSWCMGEAWLYIAERQHFVGHNCVSYMNYRLDCSHSGGLPKDIDDRTG